LAKRASLFFERQAWKQGATRVCGIDEVGIGPLAGPVVAAAVILPPKFKHSKLTDSKKLSIQLREEIFAELTTNPEVTWGMSFIQVEEIDELNILQASRKAMVEARSQLQPSHDWTLVDGRRVPGLGDNQTSIVGGDGLSFSIAAASVIAKVSRDRYMDELDKKYPGYGFKNHKGYPTPAHLKALKELGACPAHRRSFEPVRLTLQKESGL
jgi:ribonuclease HII